MEIIKNKVKDLLIDLLGYRSDEYGVKDTIQYLLDRGFTTSEIKELGFNEDEIITVNEMLKFGKRY